MRILYIAEIVGKAGIYVLKSLLNDVKKELNIDFIIACGDGATGGYGMGRNHAAYLRKLGVQALTTGECCFYKKDLVAELDRLPYVLRPFNLPPGAPGYGSRVFTVGARKIAVASLLGQTGFDRIHADSPFVVLPELLERLSRESPIVFLDFHAQATAEKLSLFHLADGRCTALIGSHTRVRTADARILEGGTAVICDAGRTGSQDSVGGTDPVSRIAEYRSGIPDWSRDAWARLELQAVVIEAADDGRALSIESVVRSVNAPEAAGERNS